jgi:hypothetical protein
LKKIHNIGLKVKYLDNSELTKLSRKPSVKKYMNVQKTSLESYPINSQYSSRNANRKLGGIFSEHRLDISPMRSTGFLKKSQGFDLGK